MVRKRLITVLTFNDGVLFRTKLFEPDYRYTLSFVDAWSVDEIVVLDVTRDAHEDRGNFFQVISNFAKDCFVPLTAGGGIRSLDDIKTYLDLGADKVVINTAAIEDPEFISEAARLYGSQCIVLSMDVRKTDGDYEVYSHFAQTPTGQTPEVWAREAEALGVGEILVTSVERDGSLAGYDLELCRRVVDATGVPVLICGGAGNWKHFEQALTTGGADAACTANIYHFTDSAITSAKRYLANAGVPVRT